MADEEAPSDSVEPAGPTDSDNGTTAINPYAGGSGGGTLAHRIATSYLADMLLGVSVPDDAVMHVGIDAYLTHLTVIEILTVLVAQRLGDAAVQRLHGVRAAFARHGIDTRAHPLQSWDGGGVGPAR